MLHILTSIDSVMYYPILIIVMAAAGIYFTCRTKFVQVRLFGEACRLVMEKPQDAKHVSSFQALMVSTASRVGTGNIIGVSTAICLGGPGAVFWMWVMCIIGASSAFIESTPVTRTAAATAARRTISSGRFTRAGSPCCSAFS